eukprot:gene129-182_t
MSASPAALEKFRAYCAQRYGTIDALNAAWGNVFWSMEYDRFDQIDLPFFTVCETNPAHRLAYRRFASEQVVRFHDVMISATLARVDSGTGRAGLTPRPGVIGSRWISVQSVTTMVCRPRRPPTHPRVDPTTPRGRDSPAVTAAVSLSLATAWINFHHSVIHRVASPREHTHARSCNPVNYGVMEINP